MSNVLAALLLTLLAGLATGLGSALAFFAKKTNPKLLSVSLGFSAGVMIYVSFVELFFKANESLAVYFGESLGRALAAIAFFGGMLIIAIIDKLVPSYENPHEINEYQELKNNPKALYRMGLLSAVAIAIHNFPEGLATFVAALKEPSVGVSIAFAIAIHNIPEGVAVSIPIYYATGSRKKAFIYSFLSGLAEPLGALVGYFFLLRFVNETFLGLIFAGVAGIMVFISLDELLPTAEKYGEHHLAIYGLVAGMVVMAVSLFLF